MTLGPDTGQAAERTVLAWERTALGILANGALLVLREPGDADAIAFVVAGYSVALALLVVYLGRRRRPTILGSPASGRIPEATGSLVLLGVGIVLLGALDLLTLW